MPPSGHRGISVSKPSGPAKSFQSGTSFVVLRFSILHDSLAPAIRFIVVTHISLGPKKWQRGGGTTALNQRATPMGAARKQPAITRNLVFTRAIEDVLVGVRRSD